ncbi:insulin-like growth factor-binding protein 3 isoform X3 [Epinephelus lanceolatus]|uniref:insulin-like growth factor-binding protein 3 isoform X3 n=1 Tax=Epinephelus lanceolatus TaxID=310571 RepID=UPI00144672F7|nr:insulin-like growth factor-binding protein 3 isoform X3 [Epinephelus lanceolatus]
MLSDATMDSCFRALCMTFVLASFTRRSGAVGPVIRCEPCDVGARLLCKPLPKDCAEKVREPGCGCCMTCALSFGQPCGVYTGRCGSGLTCQHQPGETKPLQALLEGRGVCANATNRRLTARPTPPVNELPAENVQTQDEERNSTGSGFQTLYSTHRPMGPPRPPLHPYFPSAKSEVLRREQQKRTQSFKMEELPGPLITDQQNFSLETKQEPEYCRPSKGRKRGFCWCVDKYGQPLPGFDGKERGDAQYYNSESQ